jgi:hypothetical protein
MRRVNGNLRSAAKSTPKLVGVAMVRWRQTI